ncbi:MAG: hypothetical protein ACJ8GO_03560 [Ramlibacter sp.]
MTAPNTRPARVASRHGSGPPRLALLLLVAILATLLAGIAGGLSRAGVLLPGIAATHWVGHAAAWHGALMVGGFMGSMIGVERAVALRHPLAWCAPVASAAAAAALLSGAALAGAWLLVAAASAFVAANAVLVRRQPAAHTVLLLVAAMAWLAGNVLALAGAAGTAVLAWWFTFLLLTVAAERLEMTRLMRRRPAAQPLLALVVVALLGSAGASAAAPVAGGIAFGASLLLLASWLLEFDIARRTAATQGLPRYMALCLLGGYLWLAAAGIAWAAWALGLAPRDAALHAIGLGFIGSMVLGHAPVILPAVARIKLAFGPVFYVPLAALHLSLLARLGPGLLDARWRSGGAVGNVVALALFAVVAGAAAWAWDARLQSSKP